MSETDETTLSPLDPDDDDLDWVSVAEVGEEEEAAIVAGFLKSQGIPAVVDSDKFHQTPVNFGDLAPISVMVPDEYEHQALEVLASQTVAATADTEVEASEGPSDSDV